MKLNVFALAAVWGALAASAFGQGQAINQVSGPPPSPWVSLFFYNGSNQVTYICNAPALVPTTTYSIGASTLTSIVVLTNVGTINLVATAQLWVGQRITVTGSATTALNATYTVTAVSGTTATITTAGVGNATYTDAGLTLATNGPVLNAAVWSIQAFTYVTAGGNLGTSYWAGTPGTSVPQGIACSTRASY